MTRLSAVVALCVVMLAASLTPRPSAAQSEIFASRSDTNFDIGGSNNAKFPGVAGTSNQVVVDANPSSDAKAWQKQDSAGSFGDPVTLGDANGQADYANAAVAASRFNNTFHAVWIDQDTDRIYYRNKGLTGDWNGARTVVGGTAFRVFASVGVSQEQRVFVAWSQDSRIRYRTSTDAGVSWDSTQTAGNITPIARPFVAGGPGNRAILVFGSGDGNIYAGIWNGSSFEMARITNKGSNEYFANPTATITPNGTYYVSWRDANGRGVYYSERQSNGSWPASRVAGGPIVEAAPIASDESGNLTLMWTGTAAGRNDVYYAFKPAGQPFNDIVRQNGPGGLLANMAGAATLSDRAYGHGALENFTGGGLRVRYFRFSSDAQNCLPTVVLANGASVINSRTISGTITPPAGCTPTQMRIGLNTQSDASAPLQTYSSSFSVTVPPESVGLCTQTVNVKLLANGSEGSWGSDTVTVDPGDAPNPVSALVSIEPYGQSSTLAAAQKDILEMGASTWDPGYVREPQVTLRIQDAGECSGLNTFTGGGETNRAIASLPYSFGPISIPGGPSAGFPNIGQNEVPISIVDKAGNAQTFRPTIIFDPSDTDPVGTGDNGAGKPVWAAGSTVVSDTNTLSTLRTLTFSGVKVTDNLFDPDRVADNLNDDFWGVWLAVQYLGPNGATAPVEADSTTLSWVPVKVKSRTCTENGGCSFAVTANLFSGLNYGPDTTKAGLYRVFIRVLDGAGNPSVRAEAINVPLAEGYQLPSQMMPVLFK